ncbi:uroporphyrinogen-III C-methyltransferase [Carboxylicivirga mesophila]|uniref:uroporphyrinogen-III C-methyltransferase n=1 Tax=Carboxylicivirga mesophila TaxID=1166478 RepID=A0ABS5KEF1_9BACT|nr:uroporphyrinogen-III C-methyltransferase [Carboxylicivirga mesophila]MBS2213418.1 uroporphyrinogen-III C-methyltransferase [Carboxylicivirga mesophila]
MQIQVQILAPVFNSIYHQLNTVLPKGTEIMVSSHRYENRLDTQQLMAMLMKGVDCIVVPTDKVHYPIHDEVSVVAVLANETDMLNPLLLLGLNQEKAQLFSQLESDLRIGYGRVAIAGFGPGNPELLTIKTQRLIEEADIIFHDDLLDDAYLSAYKAEKIYVGKRKGKHSAHQGTINALLYKAVLEGKKVLRLKGGDPLIFGRGGEEYHYLRQRLVDVEIVPGITSALAAAADAVVPLTSRGTSTSVAFTLGHDALYNQLPKADTLVFYMGASQQKSWARRLVKEGWPGNTPVVCVRNASLPDKEIRRYTLDELLTSKTVLPAPALLLVGQSAGQNGYLPAKKWLYTGLDLKYFKEEGSVVHNPLTELQPLTLDEKSTRMLQNIKAFDRIVFASPYAVHHFIQALFSLGLDTRVLYRNELTSIGVSTSEALMQYGLNVKPASGGNSWQGILEALKEAKVSNESVLLPCSDKGLAKLPKGIESIGCHPYELKLYKSVLPDKAVRHNLEDFYGVVFTSPASVHHFFQLYGTIPAELVLRVRGNYTQKVVEEYISQLGLSNQVLVCKDASEVEV